MSRAVTKRSQKNAERRVIISYQSALILYYILSSHRSLKLVDHFWKRSLSSNYQNQIYIIHIMNQEWIYSYVPYMSPSNSLYKGSMDPKSVTLRSSFVVFVGFFIIKRYAIVLTSFSYRIYMMISWWVVVVTVMVVVFRVFTSDDDHAQLQAYVMTLVRLRGCIVVSISSFDFYYGTI